MLLALLGSTLGFLAGLIAARRRNARAARANPPARPPAAAAAAAGECGDGPEDAWSESSRVPLGLIARAMREPIAKLRRSDACPPDALEQLERIAWQSRMLCALPRPMKAHPTSPIALLQEAAESVGLLRNGKVGVSWTIRDRQPVHVDAERARAAFVELLRAAAEAVGEGGRLAIRILPAGDGRYPIRVEIESGRRDCEVDALPVRVARRLLEAQGARIACDGPLTVVSLLCLPPDPGAQTFSNR